MFLILTMGVVCESKKIIIIFLVFSSTLQINLHGAIFGCNGDTADYIVVGVGTAGAVVAKRLTDDMRTSVIALHTGPNLSNDPLIALSANAAITVSAVITGRPLFENGDTIPQVFANNRELLWAFALPEGGASSINAGPLCAEQTSFIANGKLLLDPTGL